jgi:hypothetical protein
VAVARGHIEEITDITDPALAQRRSHWYFFLAFLVWAPVGYWGASRIPTINGALPIFGPADWFSAYIVHLDGDGLRGWGTALLIFVFFATMIVCALLGQIGQRYGQLAEDLRAQLLFRSLAGGASLRPYVLYLRPFKSTGAYLTRIRAGKYTSYEDFERLLRTAAHSIGPLVALGETLELVGGAARIVSTESSWKTAAETLMRRAQVIVILPASHAGTLWELGRLIDQKWIAKTVFIDAANDSRTTFAQETEWGHVVRLLARHGYRLPGDTPRGQVIAFGTSKEPQWVEALNITNLDSAFRYALASGLAQVTATEAPTVPARQSGDGESLDEVVVTHLGFSLAHGLIHAWASVPLAPVAIVLVVVTQAGPVAGAVYRRRRPLAGALIVAATMALALAFGLASHFLIDGTDSIDRVTGEPQVMFGLTAVLMLVIEAIGVVVAIRAARRAIARRVS